MKLGEKKKQPSIGGQKQASEAYIYTFSFNIFWIHTWKRQNCLENERGNISGSRSDKIQQIQFHSPNPNQQMWSAVINSSPANHYAPSLPSALPFSAENHRNGTELGERGELRRGKYLRLHTWLICEWTIVPCRIRNTQRICQKLLMQWIYNKPNYPVEFAYDTI